MPHLPRVVFEGWRWAEEGDGGALAGGGEVHGGGVHADEEAGAAEQPSELAPVCGAGGGLHLAAEAFAEPAGGGGFGGVRAAADQQSRNEFEQFRDQCLPILDRPGFAFPAGVHVDNGEGISGGVFVFLPWNAAGVVEP